MLSWEAFLTRYGPMARALARSVSGDSVDAEDVVQEAFLALLTAWRKDPARFEGPEHARNYLLRCVRNLALETRGRRARVRALETEPSAPSEPETERVRARQRFLAAALLELSADERELVTRRYLKRETLAHIARDTGVPVSTLHSRERALLKRLAGRLAQLDPEEGLAS